MVTDETVTDTQAKPDLDDAAEAFRNDVLIAAGALGALGALNGNDLLTRCSEGLCVAVPLLDALIELAHAYPADLRKLVEAEQGRRR